MTSSAAALADQARRVGAPSERAYRIALRAAMAVDRSGVALARARHARDGVLREPDADLGALLAVLDDASIAACALQDAADDYRAFRREVLRSRTSSTPRGLPPEVRALLRDLLDDPTLVDPVALDDVGELAGTSAAAARRLRSHPVFVADGADPLLRLDTGRQAIAGALTDAWARAAAEPAILRRAATRARAIRDRVQARRSGAT